MQILWENTQKLIQEKIPKQNYETWIKPVRILSIEENQICFAVPNRFFKDWLLDNYRHTIQECLDITMGYNTNIVFVIAQGEGRNEVSEESGTRTYHVTAPQAPANTSRMQYHHTLNTNYAFDRFVVGSSNQFAHAASIAVAEHPAKNYNPFFIYGGVGLGKTHLLNAIGLLTYTLYPDMNVLYLSAEEFINELISSIRHDKMQKFRTKFRTIDCLLIDDIQFIAGKERTQEEFFHTFNTLHDSGKQIVMTSDNFPKDIPNLEGRLRSRFEWGLIADIQPPEIETRIAILEKKAQENHIELPHDAAMYIASHADSNIRELEGFLTQTIAYSSLTKKKISLDLVRQVLNRILKTNPKSTISIDDVMKAVSERFNLKISDLKSPKKNKHLASARQMAMYLSRKLTNSSFPDIGAKMGGRDHSTVIYADNKIKKLLETDHEMKKVLQDLEDEILQRR